MKIKRPEMTASSQHSCYIKIGEYIIYLEVSEATENKPHVSFWKEYWDYDRAVTLSH
tara:strand:+ start:418 stop:588 length:171 start_codon:yes stop_codon:yes gene_type:complete